MLAGRTSIERSRRWYALAAGAVILAGLVWRSGWLPMPAFFAKYGGDALWALVVFLGFGMIFRRAATWRVALIAAGFATAIELLQLYHAPWIEAIRSTRIGRLILGTTFNGPDLAAYAVAIVAGALGEWLATRDRETGSSG